MSLRPPSTSPSPSPGPHDNNSIGGNNNSGKISARQSMGPASRGTPTLAPASPRPGASGQGSARPTSELLGSGGAMFQTPEAEALDQWFENLQNYEATLEDMAAASLDVNFKEELSAIEQWFKVLSEAERTAALYSLLQHSTQVQIRFFITVLQQMARSDPMTALLSPAMGGSMQSQMEAKLASIKSPGLKSGLPASPTGRSFPTGAGNRQSMNMNAFDHQSNNNNTYLSPESANTNAAAAAAAANAAANNAANDAAAQTLAQQRAKLKASNAAHRISAPVLSTGGGMLGDGRASWGPSTLLSQVSEQLAVSPAQDGSGGGRPKSMEFSGTPKAAAGNSTSGSPVPDGAANNNNNNNSNNNNSTAASQSILGNDSWANMVNTPLVPMFKKSTAPAAAAAASTGADRGDWHSSPAPGVPRMGDPTIHRRNLKHGGNNAGGGGGDVVYDDNGNPIHAGQGQGQGRAGGNRNASGGSWNGRSPGLAGNNNGGQSNRFDGSDAGHNNNNNNGGNFPLGSPTLGMGGLQGLQGLSNMQGLGMQPLSPFNMNNMLSMMNMSPEAQMLAAQMAASGFGQPGWMGMQPLSAGIGSAGIMGGMGMGMGMGGPGGMGGGGPHGGGRKGPGSARTPNGLRSASSVGGHSMSGAGGNSTPKGEEDVDPALLNDVAAWLRSLRLHKYTPNFEGARWEDMVMMDEEALEKKGVAALGARRKMLKTFELVRKKMGIEGGPPDSAGVLSP